MPTSLLLFGLLLGVVASVVGYIGCFSVVQSTQASSGPVSWLCLEAMLSLLRMYIWSLDLQSDDAPPLEFVLALDDEPPLPTCNKYNEYINEDKVLPLTRADQFLNSLTSFAGLIDRFDHPDLTLYYCLTRQRALGIGSETTLGEWILYVAVFDHKERTARVYTRGDTPNGFCAIESSIPVIDAEHGVLEAELGKIIDIKHDPIVGVDGIRTLLEAHYHSIMNPYSTPANMTNRRKYHIENRWTMKRADTMSAAHEESGTGASTLEPSHEATWRDTSERDHQYLEQGPVERMLEVLYALRGNWVEHYMTLVIGETRERFEGQATVRRVDGEPGGGKENAMDGDLFASQSNAMVDDGERQEMEHQLIDERRWMEMLLVYEVERWEEQLWERRRLFVGNSREKERLAREWRANCWKRLDAGIRAMDARMDAAKPTSTANSIEYHIWWIWKDMHDDIQQAWQDLVERFMEHETSSSSPSMPLQSLEHGLGKITKPTRLGFDDDLSIELLQKQREQIASRLRRELEDVEFRLTQGLDHCDQFQVDEQLLRCRHSQKKTLILHKPRLEPPLEAYSRALKQNKAPTYIVFFNFDSDDHCRWIANTIRDLLWVTSIWVLGRDLLPAIDRSIPLFIDDVRDPDIKTFLENDSQLAHSQGTFVFITRDAIAVSFVGPTSGHLVLRLKHRSIRESTSLKITGTSLQLSISSSLTIDDITLHATPSESDKPSFEPGIRNNLIIQVMRQSYSIDDIQLLDQNENCYDPASQNPEGDAASEGVSAPRCACCCQS